MRTQRCFLFIVLILFLMTLISFGQEMVFQYYFPTEAMLKQDIYLKFGNGLACDQSGNVWVVDSGEGKLLKFDPAGRFLKKVGRKGQGPGEFSRPGTIHISEDGDLLVLDDVNMRINILSAEGEFKRGIKLLRRYEDFCVSKGKIYLVYNGPREDGKTVDVFSLNGDPLGSLGEAPDFGPVIPDLARMANFKVISCDPDGRLLVGWTFFSILHILDPDQKETTAKIEIDDPRLKERYHHNLKQLNSQEPEIWRVVHRSRAHQNGILALISGEKGIEILDVDLTGKVRAIYWAPNPEEEQYVGRYFVFRKDGNTVWIYILQIMPESKVNVYKIETQL